MNFFAAAAFTCIHMCISLLLTFSLKHEETGSGATLFRGRSSIWNVFRGIWIDAHRCLLKHASLIVSRTFNGIAEIIGGFMAKVDRPKALKIKLNLSMPKRTPKRRSPNIGERKLKWVITVRRPKFHLNVTRPASENQRPLETHFLQNVQYFSSASHIHLWRHSI